MAEASVTHGTVVKETAWIPTFGALSYPQFRLFWLSNLIVAMALMVQFVAQRWLMVQLTDSALLLGIVSGVWGVTFALSSIPMGLLADRGNRRNLLVAGTLAAIEAQARVKSASAVQQKETNSQIERRDRSAIRNARMARVSSGVPVHAGMYEAGWRLMRTTSLFQSRRRRPSNP